MGQRHCPIFNARHFHLPCVGHAAAHSRVGRRTPPQLMSRGSCNGLLHPQGEHRTLLAPDRGSERDPARDEDRRKISLTLLAEEFRSLIEERSSNPQGD